MTSREIEEYKALRATIRERGTTRVWVFLAGLFAWAALTVATAALAALPVATLLPLLVLAASFEAVFSLHTGVERIGRYLQVFYEPDGSGWEQTVMAFGREAPRSGPDPLFTPFYVLATLLNFVPVILANPVPIELGVVGAVPLLFVARALVARRSAGGQRALDLQRFSHLRAQASPDSQDLRARASSQNP